MKRAEAAVAPSATTEPDWSRRRPRRQDDQSWRKSRIHLYPIQLHRQRPDRLWVAESSTCAARKRRLVLLRDRLQPPRGRLAARRAPGALLDALRMRYRRTAPRGSRPCASLGPVRRSHADAFTQVLDHRVLASTGSVGDASRQRAGRKLRRQPQDRADPRPRLVDPQQAGPSERRIRRLVNHSRLHEAIGDIPPAEFEQRHAAQTTFFGNRSVAALAEDRLSP